jgi:hypothetical protein
MPTATVFALAAAREVRQRDRPAAAGDRQVDRATEEAQPETASDWEKRSMGCSTAPAALRRSGARGCCERMRLLDAPH